MWVWQRGKGVFILDKDHEAAMGPLQKGGPALVGPIPFWGGPALVGPIPF